MLTYETRKQNHHLEAFPNCARTTIQRYGNSCSCCCRFVCPSGARLWLRRINTFCCLNMMYHGRQSNVCVCVVCLLVQQQQHEQHMHAIVPAINWSFFHKLTLSLCILYMHQTPPPSRHVGTHKHTEPVMHACITQQQCFAVCLLNSTMLCSSSTWAALSRSSFLVREKWRCGAEPWRCLAICTRRCTALVRCAGVYAHNDWARIAQLCILCTLFVFAGFFFDVQAGK